MCVFFFNKKKYLFGFLHKKGAKLNQIKDIMMINLIIIYSIKLKRHRICYSKHMPDMKIKFA